MEIPYRLVSVQRSASFPNRYDPLVGSLEQEGKTPVKNGKTRESSSLVHHVPGMLPSQTNYSSTFVENSKLKRLLLKVEKDIDKLQSAKEKRKSSATRMIRALRVSLLFRCKIRCRPNMVLFR